jgi:hypothetical protein
MHHLEEQMRAAARLCFSSRVDHDSSGTSTPSSLVRRHSPTPTQRDRRMGEGAVVLREREVRLDVRGVEVAARAAGSR